ncbi:MAG: hypothetical protein GQ574_13425 [Crocinitomix sp.]|nr:hypothetical protein [Crocinitomix sp.]
MRNFFLLNVCVILNLFASCEKRQEFEDCKNIDFSVHLAAFSEITSAGIDRLRIRSDGFDIRSATGADELLLVDRLIYYDSVYSNLAPDVYKFNFVKEDYYESPKLKCFLDMNTRNSDEPFILVPSRVLVKKGESEAIMYMGILNTETYEYGGIFIQADYDGEHEMWLPVWEGFDNRDMFDM